MKPRELHIRVEHLVVDATPGADRTALASALGQTLPAALAARLSAAERPRGAPTLHGAIADAIATQVEPRLPRQR